MHGQISPLHTLWSVSLSILLTLPSVAFAENGDCGIPHTFGSKPRTSDCLFILRAGVGSEECLGCTCDTNGNGSVAASDAQVCLRGAVGQIVPFLCPACTASGGCPASLSWSSEASFGEPCSSNSDCGGAVCDVVGTHRCTSASRVDLGWTGAGHGTDLGDGSSLKLQLSCEATDAPCGSCAVTGVDTTGGGCRCSNNPHAHCDEPFELDENDCPACEAGAFVGDACTNNADCTAGTCTRRCSDTLAPCENPADCATGTCEVATQCSNGKPCTFETDCVGTCTVSSQCLCYEGAPTPMIAGVTSVCVVQRLTGEVTGTVDVDSGAASIDEPLQLLVHVGISDRQPCPVCGGVCSNDAETLCIFDSDCASGGTCETDDVPRDGVRQGFCVGGRNEGEPCDVEATNNVFPAGTGGDGGGGTSLDCMPKSTAVVSGPGQTLGVHFATDGNTLVPALSCGGDHDDLSCPCLVCSSNPGRACSSNADCASEAGACALAPEASCDTNADCEAINVGTCLGSKTCSAAPSISCNNDNDCIAVSAGACEPSTCSSAGDADFPLPNQCDDGLCSDAGNGQGLCATGPDDTFCDDVLQGDGSPAVACTNNTDCETKSEGGTCSLVERRRCFAGAIEAVGAAHPRHPVLASAFCLAPTTFDLVNKDYGLPGPVRWQKQATQRSFCATAPAKLYRPGTGNCPD